MGTTITFAVELGDWIHSNLERGCSANDVTRALVDQHFDPRVAAGLVDAFVRARRDGAPRPTGSVVLDVDEAAYRSETPRLSAGPVIHTHDRDIPVLMRAERPTLAVLQGVLDAAECSALIAAAQGRLRPSTVVDPVTGQDSVADHRSSEGLFFRPRETPLISRIERRIAELMGCPESHGEGLQLLHYRPGAQSTPHFDFLVPSNPANVASLQRSGQRVSSLVIYLNDVPRGGETVFPEAGIAVTPRAGHAVHFEYTNSLGQVDPLSVHAGAPVETGDKWVVTKWMRERPFVSA